MIRLGSVVNSGVRITQVFGDRPDYYRQFGFAGHEGLDLAANEGTIITTATKGTVMFAGNKGNNYGNHVEIWDDEQGVRTLYAHLKDVTVSTGDRVFEGDMIGHMGRSGNTTGVHLHFMAGRTQPAQSTNILFSRDTIQTSQMLNPDNGYKGWENPQDDTIFDWPYGYGLGSPYIPNELDNTPPPTTNTPNTPENTFDSVFAQYYAGWPRLEAERDFNITYGGDVNRLRTARGITNTPSRSSTRRTENLSIPNQLELDTTKARNNFERNIAGVYIKNGSEWIYTRVGIPDFFPIGKSHFANNNGTTFATLGGWIAIPTDGNNYEGFGQDRRYQGSSFRDAGGNVKSVNVIAPPEPEEEEVAEPPTEPTIRVNSRPERAKFYIDGLYYSDLTPSNRAYPVTAGVHEVQVEKAGYKTWIESVEVGEGQQVSVMAELEEEEEQIQQETQTTYPPNQIAIDAIIVRIEKIERILTEIGRL